MTPPHRYIGICKQGTSSPILIYVRENSNGLISTAVNLLPQTGYISGVNYRKLGGTNWVNNVLLVTGLFCGPVLATFSYLNTVAIFYRSTAALPFGTIVIIILIWALVTFPLTVLGGIVAKNSKLEFNAPCRWLSRPFLSIRS